jgi:very-short-patch-repair endonuclease
MNGFSDPCPNTLLPQLETIPSGRARLFVCQEIPEHLAAIELSQLKREVSLRGKLVAHIFNPLPTLETVSDRTLAALAEVALALWPNWYGQQLESAPRGSVAPAYSDLCRKPLTSLDTRPHRISGSWFNAAARLCRENKAPLCRRFPVALQVQQLALALCPQELMIILAAEEPKPAAQRLFGLARAAEWYAKEAAARVMVLIPASAAVPEELESLFYGGTIPSTSAASPNLPLPALVPETKLRYWPVEGAPHPFSPGEQLLAQRLADDPELATLFEFNQRVSTVRNTHYLVDLLWRAGKLIVEVDGFRSHTRRAAFFSDRHRDYELLLSGYTTLRLSHEEVLCDSHQALEKIRDVVRFCGNNPDIKRITSEESP